MIHRQAVMRAQCTALLIFFMPFWSGCDEGSAGQDALDACIEHSGRLDIDSVRPDELSIAGGQLTITGDHFVGRIQVFLNQGLGDFECENVDILDPGTLTCDAPAWVPGEVSIRVVRSNQCDPDRTEAIFEEAFLYDELPTSDAGPLMPDVEPPDDEDAEELEALTLNSLLPNRGPVSGGTSLRIVGSGFLDNISVLIGGRSCTEVVINSPNNLQCVTPAGVPGSAPVTVVRINRSASDQEDPDIDGTPFRETATVEDGFTYFEEVTLTGVVPTRSPTRGGTQLILEGTGLIEGTQVTIGGANADNFTVADDGTVSVVSPPGAPGAADVVAVNFNGMATLPQGVFYYEEISIESLYPPVGPLSGGQGVRLDGRGLTASSSVSFGANAAEVLDANEERTRMNVRTPRGAVPGPVDVQISNDNGGAEVRDGYVYFDDLANGFQVAGIAPNRGPLDGGTEVWVAGNGFSASTTVYFDGREIECVLENANQLRCTSPPGFEGRVPVTVTEGSESLDVDGGFTYFLALELIAIQPDSGSVAGGAFVTLTGSGFSPDTQFLLGEAPLQDVLFIDDTTMIGITPPNTPGTVDVIALTEFSRARIPAGFNYFEPASDFGGVWGDPVDASVNITVIHGGSGARLSEAAVVAINQGDNFRIEGVTNAQGQVTLSDLALRAPLNITAAKEGFEATTIEDVEVSNVTIILIPNDGEGEPPPPIPLVTISGVVTGLDVLPKPVNELYVNVIVVETSHSSPNNRSRLPPPGPGGLLTEDGPYQIIARPGEIAIIATAGELDRSALLAYQNGEIDYWTMRRYLNPLAMGLRRFISGSPGDILEGQDVEIDHPMDVIIPVDLDNPPAGADPGPRTYMALPRLNLGAEGYWELDTDAVSADPNLTLRKMPSLDGWDADITYYVLGIAFSATESGLPYSISVEETRDVEAGLFISPFVGSPFVLSPEDFGRLGEGQRFIWGVHDGFEGPITPPSANLVQISEPALGPPKPLWRYITPSLVTHFEVPDLPQEAGAAGLGQGQMFLTILPFYIDNEEFDFEDFTYDDIAQYRWKSWAVGEIVFQR